MFCKRTGHGNDGINDLGDSLGGDVEMHVCLTETERRTVESCILKLVESEQTVSQLVDTLVALVTKMAGCSQGLADMIHDVVATKHNRHLKLPPRKHYKPMRHIGKCSFSQRDISLTVRHRWLCRDNC